MKRNARLLFTALEIRLRVLSILGKLSTSELHSQPFETLDPNDTVWGLNLTKPKAPELYPYAFQLILFLFNLMWVDFFVV